MSAVHTESTITTSITMIINANYYVITINILLKKVILTEVDSRVPAQMMTEVVSGVVLDRIQSNFMNGSNIDSHSKSIRRTSGMR